MTTEPPDKMPAGMTSGTPQVLLAHHFKQLKLPTVLQEYDKVACECARDGVDHPRYLLRLVELELIDRERRVVERRIKQARFPATKSLDTFDFTAIASVNKMLVLELARCEFILRREKVIALGISGTGKTHVALVLGIAACQKGFPVDALQQCRSLARHARMAGFVAVDVVGQSPLVLHELLPADITRMGSLKANLPVRDGDLGRPRAINAMAKPPAIHPPRP
ncbi:ATP-binding protein [Mesorhizobium sp.]|uniref:ATP-binding protein n=1 Tax=Mesorhizobium sp. TaxID=1871066 RepID=UPI00258290F7|nr:ATP-binding protein [Mesorhizobium sp.]